MSNHLAVAAATRTLAQLLDGRLSHDFPGAHVHPARPDAAAGDDSDPEVRLFLYRVEPSAAWRNEALAARSPSGQAYERPQIGLSLHYLLTFVGNEARLEPQRMLGSVVRTLTARPLLTRAEIEAMVAAALAEDPNHPLGRTDLAEQPDIVRLNPLPLTADELSTLWSNLFQSPYRLSVAYEACVVVLTSDETQTRALPVRERRILPTTLLSPTVQRVVAAAGEPHGPILPGTTVVVSGDRLRGEEVTVVAFGGIEVTPAPEAVSGARIEVVVPDPVRAGVTGLRVIHRRRMGEPPRPRAAGQSSAFPIVIRPRLLPLAAGAVHDVRVDPETGLRSGGVKVGVRPPVGRRQQVTMMLNAVPGGTARSLVFEDERRDGEEDEATTDLDIPFTAVPAGRYLIRIGVDGAETPLTVDTTAGSPTEGQYIGPEVVVP